MISSEDIGMKPSLPLLRSKSQCWHPRSISACSNIVLFSRQGIQPHTIPRLKSSHTATPPSLLLSSPPPPHSSSASPSYHRTSYASSTPQPDTPSHNTPQSHTPHTASHLPSHKPRNSSSQTAPSVPPPPSPSLRPAAPSIGFSPRIRNACSRRQGRRQ